jgi:arabinan endo-1,5-alpha-L-arabinosidase
MKISCQIIQLLFLLLFLSGCKTAGGLNETPSPQDENMVYRNPVVDRSLPDPTVIRAKDGNFYLYATEDTRNTPIFRSPNLVDWTFVGTAFTDQTRPSFEPKGGIWAPDINYINGTYVLYYSMSVWGGEWTCGIGVATADSPRGTLHRSRQTVSQQRDWRTELHRPLLH